MKPSAQKLLAELKNHQVPIYPIEGESNGFFAKIGNKLEYLRGIHTPLNTQTSVLLANNKVAAKEAFNILNLPTLPYLFFGKDADWDTSIKKIDSFLTEHGRIIAKPANGLKSLDIFLEITSVKAAKTAWDVVLNKPYIGILFEKYHPGLIFRLLYLKGDLIAALCREKAFVIGDGMSTVDRLIEERNELLRNSGRLVKQIVKEEALMVRLQKQECALTSVIDAGKKVWLADDFSGSETVTEVTDKVAPEIKQKIGEFCKLVGLGLCGVDVITTDISKPSDYFVLEVNKEPAIDFHHAPDYGKPINVAKLIVEAILSESLS